MHPTPLRPPNAGQPIRSPYLKQEYRLLRAAHPPHPNGPGWALFYAPAGGIAAANRTGDIITPASELCQMARWTGTNWVPDDGMPMFEVFNSFEHSAVPAGVIMDCRYEWSHWEAKVWDCPPPP